MELVIATKVTRAAVLETRYKTSFSADSWKAFIGSVGQRDATRPYWGHLIGAELPLVRQEKLATAFATALAATRPSQRRGSLARLVSANLTREKVTICFISTRNNLLPARRMREHHSARAELQRHTQVGLSLQELSYLLHDVTALDFDQVAITRYKRSPLAAVVGPRGKLTFVSVETPPRQFAKQLAHLAKIDNAQPPRPQPGDSEPQPPQSKNQGDEK